MAMGKDSKWSNQNDDKGTSRTMQRDSEQSKSHGVLNKPFDEALEFSQSGSDDSVDTRLSDKKGRSQPGVESKNPGPSSSSAINYPKPGAGGAVPMAQLPSNTAKQAMQLVRFKQRIHVTSLI